MRIEVQPYNPQWPTDFKNISSELREALQGIEIVCIEHIGSTSVPGMAAKPIIDIDIVVSPHSLSPATNALVEKGGCENMGEWGVRGRVAFRKLDAVPRRNVYLYLEDSVGFRNHIALRDTCRNDDRVRDVYSKAKMELAGREWKDVDEYGRAKNEIVQWVLAKAGVFSEADMREIASQNKI